MSLKKSLPTQRTFNSEDNPQVTLFLKNLKPDPRAVYLHIPAVSAGEAYGPNNWGDYFPEESLKKNYKSFYDAKVYRRHKNKDPRKSVGDVVLALYNDKMRRVELVVKIYRDLAKDIAEDADKGKPVGFSMGCRVPYEQCSICRKKIFKTADRCDHLKHSVNELVDGKLCYSINEFPRFFDISETPTPADKGVWSIRKVASDLQEADGSHVQELSEEEMVEGFLACSALYYTPREAQFKEASLDTLKKIASEGIAGAMTASLINGFCFTPKEFQYLALAEESEKLAEQLYRDGSSFESLPGFLSKDLSEFNKIADELMPAFNLTTVTPTVQDAITEDLLSRNPERSARAGISQLLAQVSKEVAPKADTMDLQPSNEGIGQFPAVLDLLLSAGLLYGGYRWASSKIPEASILSILKSQPAQVMGAIGGLELAKRNMRSDILAEKTASEFSLEKYAGWLKHGLVGLGASYGLSTEAYRRNYNGAKVPGPLRTIAQNPVLSTIGLGLLSAKGGKMLSKVGKGSVKVPGLRKKASDNELQFDAHGEWLQCISMEDVFRASSVPVDSEISTLADEQFRSVDRLFN
jgi:hypothetical protein